jgi:hypothetical protein
MRIVALLLAVVMIGCAGNNGSVEHKEPSDSSSVPPPDANTPDGGSSGSDVPFIPPNADTGDDAGCFYGQYLLCWEAPGIAIPSCGVVCVVGPTSHYSILGPSCYTCANPNDINNCGWVCQDNQDAGAQDASTE